MAIVSEYRVAVLEKDVAILGYWVALPGYRLAVLEFTVAIVGSRLTVL